MNLTQTKFSRDQISTLKLGFDYAIEKDPKKQEWNTRGSPPAGWEPQAYCFRSERSCSL